MKIFKVGDKEYKMIESWEEMSLGQYINFYKLQEQRKDGGVDDLYLMELVEYFSDCRELISLPYSQIAELMETLKFLLKKPKLSNNRTIFFNSKEYSFVNMNELTTGEVITIKMFQQDIKDYLSSIPYILSVILRPSVTTKDKETGEDRIKIEEFQVENLTWRVKNYPNMFKACDVMQWITFFLTMTNPSSQIIQHSSKSKVGNQTPSLQKSQNNSIGS